MPPAGQFSTSISEPVRRFFEEFERNANALALDRIGPQYGEVFMFANPEGARAVRRDDLLKVLPKRREFFTNLGLTHTTYTTLEEQRIDDHYIMVEAHLTMHFAKDPAHPVENNDSSTFILRQSGDHLEIACHIEHDDATHRMQLLGLLPAGPQ